MKFSVTLKQYEESPGCRNILVNGEEQRDVWVYDWLENEKLAGYKVVSLYNAGLRFKRNAHIQTFYVEDKPEHSDEFATKEEALEAARGAVESAITKRKQCGVASRTS